MGGASLETFSGEAQLKKNTLYHFVFFFKFKVREHTRRQGRLLLQLQPLYLLEELMGGRSFLIVQHSSLSLKDFACPHIRSLPRSYQDEHKFATLIISFSSVSVYSWVVACLLMYTILSSALYITSGIPVVTQPLSSNSMTQCGSKNPLAKLAPASTSHQQQPYPLSLWFSAPSEEVVLTGSGGIRPSSFSSIGTNRRLTFDGSQANAGGECHIQ